LSVHAGSRFRYNSTRFCITRLRWVLRSKTHGDSLVSKNAETWLEALSDFEWHGGNRSKYGKDRVEPSEVESLFQRTVSLAGRIVEPTHDEPRWLLPGETTAGSRLALIFTRRGDKLRPISCRPMRRNERRLYDEAKGSEEGR
jgi:uncharacterized DUF497 family protein